MRSWAGRATGAPSPRRTASTIRSGCGPASSCSSPAPPTRLAGPEAGMGIGALADLLGGGGGVDPNVVPATQCKVEVDGTELSEEIAALLERVTVTDRLRMPDSCTLAFRDNEHKVLSETEIEIGGKIKISATTPGGKSPE